MSTAPFMPNLKTRAEHYLPPDHHLPAGEVKAMVFDCPNVGGMGTQIVSLNVPHDSVIWAITAVCSAAESFRMQIYHGHGQNQRQVFNKALPAGMVAGTGRKPLPLKETYFVSAGDVLSVEVHSLAAAAANIQITLWLVQP